MKFESKFGLGEVCIYNHDVSYKPGSVDERTVTDILVKIVDITFNTQGIVYYTIELTTQAAGIQRLSVNENSLTGDPAFDQEAGEYPEEDE